MRRQVDAHCGDRRGGGDREDLDAHGAGPETAATGQSAAGGFVSSGLIRKRRLVFTRVGGMARAAFA